MPAEKARDRILVVDDEPGTLEVIRRNLVSRGYVVHTAADVAEAIGLLESTPVDLVITDMKMPKVSGLDLVRHVRENCADTEVMMITGFATVEGAVEAVKIGADEYLPKPFTDEELFGAVGRLLDKLHTRRAGRPSAHSDSMAAHGIISGSKAMKKVFGFVDKAATTTATVLITGESGTGKELVSRAIHYRGKRASAPFVPVNCGGIPESLLESELFGHVKGAFTGATSTQAGFFQTAEGGTIFLDEISETSLAMQVKLLRVLQEKEVYMVGSPKPAKVDVRVIAATNKDLPAMVRKGLFREDLFFRLDVIAINLPPLRERGDDALLLANHFVRRFAEEYDKPPLRFSDAAIHILQRYQWLGNVRELQNMVQRLVVMSEGGEIDAADLPEPMRFSIPGSVGVDRTLAEVEAAYIRRVLESVRGNKTQAAKILGIDRKTLREKIARYAI